MEGGKERDSEREIGRNRETEVQRKTELERCGEAEGCVMNGGMTGVMKEGTGDEERQMDHHDITLVCAYVCVRISTFPRTSQLCVC